MSETLSRPKCVQMPAPAVVVEDQIDRVLEQVAAPVAADLSAFATPTQVGRRLAALKGILDKLEQTEGCMGVSFNRYSKERDALIDLIFTMQPGNLHDVVLSSAPRLTRWACSRVSTSPGKRSTNIPRSYSAQSAAR